MKYNHLENHNLPEEENLKEIIAILVLEGQNLSSLLLYKLLIKINKTLLEIMKISPLIYLEGVKKSKFTLLTKAPIIRKGHQERRKRRERG